MDIRARKEIRSLTGLRGIAAVYVMMYHYAFSGFYEKPGIIAAFICHGYLAVNLFFILSGFVMAMTYGEEFVGGFRREAYLSFLVKRMGRIYPLYSVATIVCALIGLWHLSYQAPLTPAHIATNLLLIQTWGFSESIDPPAWSISTEVGAYLMFPALAAFLLFSKARVAVTGGLLAIAALIMLSMLPGAVVHETGIRPGPLAIWVGSTCYPLVSCVACFSLGLLTWRAMQVPALVLLAQNHAVGVIAMAGTLALLCVHISDVLIVMTFIPLLMTLVTGASPATRLLASRPLHWLGLVSYSIYLVHWPIGDALRAPLQVLDHAWSWGVSPSMLVSGILAITLAGVVHYLIERPGRNLVRVALQKRTSAMYAQSVA